MIFSIALAGLACAADAPMLEAATSANGALSLTAAGRALGEFPVDSLDRGWRHSQAVADPKGAPVSKDGAALQKFSLKTSGDEIKGDTTTLEDLGVLAQLAHLED